MQNVRCVRVARLSLHAPAIHIAAAAAENYETQDGNEKRSTSPNKRAKKCAHFAACVCECATGSVRSVSCVDLTRKRIVFAYQPADSAFAASETKKQEKNAVKGGFGVTFEANDGSIEHFWYGDDESIVSLTNSRLLAIEALLEGFVVIFAGGSVFWVASDALKQAACIGSFAPAEIVACRASPDAEILAFVVKTANEHEEAPFKLLLMSATFDVVAEQPLTLEADAAMHQSHAVGWGSAETQFKGPGARLAASASVSGACEASGASIAASATTAAQNNAQVNVNWRSDSEYLAITTPESTKRHRLRIFARTGALFAVADEASAVGNGGESLAYGAACAWRPTTFFLTAIVAPIDAAARCSQGDSLAVVERNGLFFALADANHRISTSEVFALKNAPKTRDHSPEPMNVRRIAWNCDGTLLAVLLADDCLRFYTVSNGHWFCKGQVDTFAQFDCRAADAEIAFHAENAFSFVLGDETRGCVWQLFLQLEHWTEPLLLPSPADDAATGAVFVVDEGRLGVTPMRLAAVPPPLCAFSVPLPATPAAFCAASFGDVWTVGGGGGMAASMTLIRTQISVSALKSEFALQSQQILHTFNGVRLVVSLAVTAFGDWAAIGVDEAGDCLLLFNGSVIEASSLFGGGMRPIALWPDAHRTCIFVQTADDAVWLLEKPHESPKQPLVARFLYRANMHIDRADCVLYAAPIRNQSAAAAASQQPKRFFVEWNAAQRRLCVRSGSQDAHDNSNSAMLLYEAWAVSSFICTRHFCVFCVAGERTALQFFSFESGSLIDASRPLETGAVIVAAVEATGAVVYEVPRGNIETVYPRPLVEDHVTTLVAAGAYAEAFSACRRHRIDMQLLVHASTPSFEANVAEFVKQVPSGDSLALFLTSMRPNEHRAFSEEDLRRVACILRTHLMHSCDLLPNCSFVAPILTAFVREAAIDDALEFCRSFALRTTQPSQHVHALKYLMLLAPAALLYERALLRCDWAQAVLIARNAASMDVREVVAFVRRLESADKRVASFVIRDFFGRPREALPFLVEHELCENAVIQSANINDEAFQTNDEMEEVKKEPISHAEGFLLPRVAAYVAKHALYTAALDLYVNAVSHVDGSQTAFRLMARSYAEVLAAKTATENTAFDAATFFVLGGDLTQAATQFLRVASPAFRCWREAVVCDAPRISASLFADLSAAKQHTEAFAFASLHTIAALLATISSQKQTEQPLYSEEPFAVAKEAAKNAWDALLRGNAWTDAAVVCSLAAADPKKSASPASDVSPLQSQLLQAMRFRIAAISDQIGALKTHFDGRRTRLQTLRNQPPPNSDKIPDDDACNDRMEVLSTTSTKNSAVSRGTTAIAASQSPTCSSNRSRRRFARAKVRAREGGIYEEDFLLLEMQKAFEGAEGMLLEVRSLLRVGAAFASGDPPHFQSTLGSELLQLHAAMRAFCAHLNAHHAVFAAACVGAGAIDAEGNHVIAHYVKPWTEPALLNDAAMLYAF